jgi:hypothetical protein
MLAGKTVRRKSARGAMTVYGQVEKIERGQGYGVNGGKRDTTVCDSGAIPFRR